MIIKCQRLVCCSIYFCCEVSVALGVLSWYLFLYFIICQCCSRIAYNSHVVYYIL
jgi:hypothetical protein